MSMYVLLEAPYVSSVLKAAIIENGVKVLNSDFARAQALPDKLYTDVTPEEHDSLYSNSENALDWIARHLPGSPVLQRIQKLKDKVRFREEIKAMHPDFFFSKATLAEMSTWDSLPSDKTIIIKPSIGFLSLGVIKVNGNEQWPLKKEKLISNLRQLKNYYPEAVVNANAFILEEYLDGSEFAIDAYFDDNGDPVILNISEHLFASASDVNDRVYFTSKSVMEKHLEAFSVYLKNTGQLLGLRNFPVHAEVRITSAHGIVPIEFNALRFGGWCTSADVAYHAFGFNPYSYYFNHQSPDWENILHHMDDATYSFVMLDNTSAVKTEDIQAFDIQRLAREMESVLEIRQFDHHQFPIFGILLTKTSPGKLSELQHILTSDLVEYMERSSGN